MIRHHLGMMENEEPNQRVRVDILATKALSKILAKLDPAEANMDAQKSSLS